MQSLNGLWNQTLYQNGFFSLWSEQPWRTIKIFPECAAEGFPFQRLGSRSPMVVKAFAKRPRSVRKRPRSVRKAFACVAHSQPSHPSS